MTLPLLLLLALAATAAEAQRPAPADRAVYLDDHGVIRWKDDCREVGQGP